MPRDNRRRVANPVKQQGMSKRKTQQLTDHANPRGRRQPAAAPATAQGGSPKGRRRSPDSPHPGQRGGITFDRPDPAERANARKGKQPGRKQPGAGLTKASSRARGRTEGRTRTGSTGESRGRARGGERQ